jgi:hypothetical protein
MSRIGPVVRPVVCGVAASAVGTLAMDASIYRRFRRRGGTEEFPNWEFSEGLTSWENAPPPARVAKKVLERVLGREVPPRYARFLNNATHWGMGVGAGAVYGLLVGSRQSKLWYGVPFGAAVWAGGYVVLPQLGVYEEIWKYDLETLAKDLGAHLVFGSATAGAFALLCPHHKMTSDKTRTELAWPRR